MPSKSFVSASSNTSTLGVRLLPSLAEPKSLNQRLPCCEEVEEVSDAKSVEPLREDEALVLVAVPCPKIGGSESPEEEEESDPQQSFSPEEEPEPGGGESRTESEEWSRAFGSA